MVRLNRRKRILKHNFACHRTQVNGYKNILLSIKAAGNQLYAKKDFINSCRKYKKSIRYYNYIMDKLAKKLPKSVDSDATAPLDEFHLKTQLNLAAVELKLKNYVNVKHACDEVIVKCYNFVIATP